MQRSPEWRLLARERAQRGGSGRQDAGADHELSPAVSRESDQGPAGPPPVKSPALYGLVGSSPTSGTNPFPESWGLSVRRPNMSPDPSRQQLDVSKRGSDGFSMDPVARNEGRREARVAALGGRRRARSIGGTAHERRVSPPEGSLPSPIARAACIAPSVEVLCAPTALRHPRRRIAQVLAEAPVTGCRASIVDGQLRQGMYGIVDGRWMIGATEKRQVGECPFRVVGCFLRLR